MHVAVCCPFKYGKQILMLQAVLMIGRLTTKD